MDIIEMDASWQERFLSRAKRSALEYFWFLTDLAYRPEATRVKLAIEDEEILGASLTYDDKIVQIRGGEKVVAALLDTVDQESLELNLPGGTALLAQQRFVFQSCEEIMLMYLPKGQERLRPSTRVENLLPEEAEEIASLIHRAGLDWWSELTPDAIRSSMRENVWVGIREGSRVVAVGYAWMTPPRSNIGIIATEEEYRNRGYATAVVSELVALILARMEMAIIHVRVSNAPAVHTYSKLGFLPHLHYDVVKTKGRKRTIES